jgi:carboxyl-terminal processing protease
MRIDKNFKAGAVVLAVVLAFILGVQTGVGDRVSRAAAQAVPGITIDLTRDTQPSGVSFNEFWKAWNLLEQNFVETNSSTTIPTHKERIYGAIAGLTESYGDPYTVFFPPAEAQAFHDDLEGEFGGVGMELGLKEGRLVVVAPLKGSPAERAGVRSGDYVVAVDDKPTQGFAVEDAVKVIRGPKGTPVKLTFEREGAPEPIVVTIIRDTIQVPLIEHGLRDDGIYSIALYSFSANSAELFRGALRGFAQSGSNKLLFDLRGNPGGYLEASVQMASFFLPTGDVIVTEDYKGKRDNVYHRSLG